MDPSASTCSWPVSGLPAGSTRNACPTSRRIRPRASCNDSSIGPLSRSRRSSQKTSRRRVSAELKRAEGEFQRSDNGKAFTDRFAANGERIPTGKHPFDQVCQAHGIEHRLIRPRAVAVPAAWSSASTGVSARCWPPPAFSPVNIWSRPYSATPPYTTSPDPRRRSAISHLKRPSKTGMLNDPICSKKVFIIRRDLTQAFRRHVMRQLSESQPRTGYLRFPLKFWIPAFAGMTWRVRRPTWVLSPRHVRTSAARYTLQRGGVDLEYLETWSSKLSTPRLRYVMGTG